MREAERRLPLCHKDDNESGEREQKEREGARDGCIPNFTLKGDDTANGFPSLSPPCAVFPAIIPHSHLARSLTSASSSSSAVICLYGGSQAREIAPLGETDLPFAAAAAGAAASVPVPVPHFNLKSSAAGAWI